MSIFKTYVLITCILYATNGFSGGLTHHIQVSANNPVKCNLDTGSTAFVDFDLSSGSGIRKAGISFQIECNAANADPTITATMPRWIGNSQEAPANAVAVLVANEKNVPTPIVNTAFALTKGLTNAGITTYLLENAAIYFGEAPDSSTIVTPPSKAPGRYIQQAITLNISF